MMLIALAPEPFKRRRSGNFELLPWEEMERDITHEPINEITMQHVNWPSGKQHTRRLDVCSETTHSRVNQGAE